MSFITELPVTTRQPRIRRSAQIAEQIKSMIFNGELKPGDRIPTEEKLCHHFDVSRTTLRESIQMLRVSGLLTVTPGRGSFIAMPDISMLLKDLTLFAKYTPSANQEVSFIRQALQVEIAAKACSAKQDSKKGLYIHSVHKDASPEENEKAERLWHISMAKLAGDKITSSIIEALLMIIQNQNIEKYKDPDEIMRTMGVQIRLNSAIIENNKEVASRIMSSFLAVQPQGQQMVA
jgi:GntR family transcriptional repressor for pyruvate dehydrogenase complex